MIDEADEAMPGQQPNRKRAHEHNTPPMSPRHNKRKPGNKKIAKKKKLPINYIKKNIFIL